MDFSNPVPLIVAVVLLGLLGAVLVYAARVAQPQPDAPAGPPTGAIAMERKIVATGPSKAITRSLAEATEAVPPTA